MTSDPSTLPHPTAAERGLPPMPWGWFVIALSADLAPGDVRPLRYFGRELVLFRTAAGKACLWDAHCPHLGAHLGHGGRVEGESIRCAFHHWRFDTDGRCVEVPGCERIPPKGQARPWSIIEQNGTILAWYHPEGTPPSFEMDALPDEGWTEPLSILWDLRSHPQEIGENTVDIAHMKPVHETGVSRVRYGPDLEGGTMKIGLYFLASGEIIGMDGLNDVELDVTMYGLGIISVQAHVTNAGVRARYRICSTPIDDGRIHIYGIANMLATDDPEYTEEVAGLFFEALTNDFVKDFPIWENKVYRDRPALSGADGPIGAYRRFSKQFYPKAGTRPRDVERPAAARDEAVPSSRPREVLHSVRGLLSRVRGTVDDVRTSVLGRVTGIRDPEPRDAAEAGTSGHAGANGHTGSNGHAGANGRAGTNGRANAPALRVDSVEHYFDTLGERFRPAGAKGVRAVFQWELAGEGGGTYHAIVDDGTMELHEGDHDSPTVTLQMSADEYVKVVNGDLDGTRAFTVGSGKVRGKLRMAMKMRDIFPQ